MPSPIRVVVPIDSQDPSAWAHALAYAEMIGAQAEPAARDYILLTHTKQQLSQTSLGNHVGAAQAKTLLANKDLGLPNGARLRHATLQTLRGSARQAMIIAYFAEDKMMETIDGLTGVIGVVAVPHYAGEVDGWIARWNPVIHGQQSTAAVPLISDSVVAKALESLSGSVNLSHSVMNPRDKQRANETLRILRAKGHTLEREKIKSWAIRNGWQPSAADELAKLAGKVQALKATPSISGYHDPTGRYARWNE